MTYGKKKKKIHSFYMLAKGVTYTEKKTQPKVNTHRCNSDTVPVLAFGAAWKSFRGMRVNIFLFHLSITCLCAGHCASLFPAGPCPASLF